LDLNTYLINLFNSNQFNKQDFIDFHDEIKPLFMGKGFMSWIRKESSKKIKQELALFREDLVTSAMNADELVITYTDYANREQQGTQHEQFFDLPQKFLAWNPNELPNKLKEASNIIKVALSTQGRQREKAISHISLLGEKSNAQSRKVTSGAAAEDVVELVLNQAGLELGKGYAKQWKSSSGSDTDFIIPYANHGLHEDVRAYISLQSPTHDRERLSRTEARPVGKGGRAGEGAR